MRQVPDADIDTAIQDHLRDVNYGQVLASRGFEIVGLDDDGRIRRYYPEGESTSAATPETEGSGS